MEGKMEDRLERKEKLLTLTGCLLYLLAALVLAAFFLAHCRRVLF